MQRYQHTDYGQHACKQFVQPHREEGASVVLHQHHEAAPLVAVEPDGARHEARQQVGDEGPERGRGLERGDDGAHEQQRERRLRLHLLHRLRVAQCMSGCVT